MLLELLEARRLGLAVPATLLVKAYHDAHGAVPKTTLAEALAISVRTVERALAELKGLGIRVSACAATTSSVSHDHVHASSNDLSNHQEHEHRHEHEDRLLAHDVLPWCVKVILEKCDPDVVRRQLDYHEFRLQAGFQARTEGGAAKLLFKACLNDWPAPKGFFERRERTVTAAEPVAASQPEPAPATASAPIPFKSRWARCRASGLAFPIRHWFGDGCVLVLPDGDNELVDAPRYGLYDWLVGDPVAS